MVSQSTIQHITNRIDIVEIIGEYVKLKKRGANYLGNCPFHNEKTPSFTVSPTKEIYKCFGCGKSGNTIGFLMEHDNLSYVEALKWLAARYNIPIEETETPPEIKQQQQLSGSLFIINAFAQKHFTKKLLEDEEGKDIALAYLKHRGLREDIIRKFQLGYSLDKKDDFTTAALNNQYNPDLLQKAGLVSIRNDIPVDNYRGRIIFPIHNTSGKILGFGARVIKSTEKAPKYINTPENEIYVKSKILYGVYLARQAIDRSDECLLVEGYTDVISLHQAGIENVVASGGTSLTIDQLRLVKKYTNNLTIIYDGDSAGVKAALRGLDMAVEESLNVRLVLIPDNEDPDSYVNKIGPGAFKTFIEANRKDFILFQLEVMLEDAEGDINKKAQVVNRIAETLSKLNKEEDFTKLQDYIRQCSNALKIDEGGLMNLVNKLRRNKIIKDDKQLSFQNAAEIKQEENGNVAEISSYVNHDDAQEKNVLRVLLEYGLKPWDDQKTMAEFIFSELQEFHFQNQQFENLFELYRKQYYDALHPTAKSLLYHEDKEMRDIVISINIVPYELSPNWDNIMEGLNINNRDTSRQDVLMSVNYFKLRKIKRMFEENQRDMEKATSIDEQMNLIQIHKVLKSEEQKITQQLGTVILK